MIFNHIFNYPGVSFNVLKNIFELTDGGLRYHLDYLEKHEKINSELAKGARCYYPSDNGFSISTSQKSYGISGLHRLTSQQERILDVIRHHPGIHQKDLIFKTKLTRFQVSKNLHKLQGLNLIKKNRTEGQVCYEYVPDDELKYKLMKRLVIKLLKGEIDEAAFLELKRKLE
jgi:predicted transcriptional regulator